MVCLDAAVDDVLTFWANAAEMTDESPDRTKARDALGRNMSEVTRRRRAGVKDGISPREVRIVL